MQALATFFQAHPKTALSDLNWGRLTPWRQLLAQFFDLQEFRSYLSGIEQIEIEYAAPIQAQRDEISPEPANPTAALLLAGWLNDSLGLELESTSHQHSACRDGQYEWTISGETRPEGLLIRPDTNASDQPGALTLVRLTCQSAGQRAIFTIQREKGSDAVLTSVDAAGCTLPVRKVMLPAFHNECDLLRNELEIMGHDTFYERALGEVRLLLKQDS
jgi:glucose-6-phosphate dehydrogenase assembly protein OpcA